MPLDGGAVSGGLHVDLAAGPHADVLADEFREDVRNRAVRRHFAVERVRPPGLLDAPHPRAVGGMARFQVEELAVPGQAARAGGHFVGHAAQFGEGRAVEQTLDDQIAAFAVAGDLAGADHAPSPPPIFGSR